MGAAALILGLDAAAKTCAVALYDGKLVAQRFVDNGLTHSQTLLPLIAELLASCGVAPTALDGVAVTIGPGSFTGLRIGLATAQALAWPDLPCVGVSTLHALAVGVADQGDGQICACMDARRNQVYNALFESNNGQLKRLCDDRALALDELASQLDNPLFVGDALSLCTQAYSAKHRLPPPSLAHVTGEAVCRAAWPLFQRGETVACHELVPVYLRLPQAERELLAKQNVNTVASHLR